MAGICVAWLIRVVRGCLKADTLSMHERELEICGA